MCVSQLSVVDDSNKSALGFISKNTIYIIIHIITKNIQNLNVYNEYGFGGSNVIYDDCYYYGVPTYRSLNIFSRLRVSLSVG